MKQFDDINDDEIRLINRDDATQNPWYRRWWFWAIAAATLLLVALLVGLLRRDTVQTEESIAEDFVAESVSVAPGVVQETGPASVSVSDTTVNDVELCLYTPMNAMPELCLGMPDTTDLSIVLALQAADIRADNRQIVGAFVLNGELLSRGMSKKGFCAIIGDQVHLGMAESTPLLEEAIEKEGSFFRQYPLVSGGQMVENKPKGKAERRALCEMKGQLLVVSSLGRESFHDFAQALADLGVEQAIYLTGSSSYGFCRNDQQILISWGDASTAAKFENSNFIVWKRK